MKQLTVVLLLSLAMSAPALAGGSGVLYSEWREYGGHYAAELGGSSIRSIHLDDGEAGFSVAEGKRFGKALLLSGLIIGSAYAITNLQ